MSLNPQHVGVRDTDQRDMTVFSVHINTRHDGFLLTLSKMPRQPTVTEIHLNNIIALLEPATTLLNDLDQGFGTPFVQAL